MTFTDALQLLGLTAGASDAEIKQAYRDLARVWHPDRFPNDPRLFAMAQEKLKAINAAYERLKEPAPHFAPRQAAKTAPTESPKTTPTESAKSESRSPKSWHKSEQASTRQLILSYLTSLIADIGAFIISAVIGPPVLAMLLAILLAISSVILSVGERMTSPRVEWYRPTQTSQAPMNQ